MRIIRENKSSKKKIITSFSNYFSFVNESSSYDPQEIIRKMKRVILWININQGFYGELLSHVNIYGSSKLNPKTMCTTGRDIIFHPEFVMKWDEEVLRLVICHEILHCIGGHYERRGGRDPKGWNIACDYAINPILVGEKGMKFPTLPNGIPDALYDKKYEGMRAEDIYDLLKESGELDKLIEDSRIQDSMNNTGKVMDEDANPPDVDGDLVIQDGSEIEPNLMDDEEIDNGNSEIDQNSQGILPKVGQKVITDDGTEGIVTKVYPNGDIEIF